MVSAPVCKAKAGGEKLEGLSLTGSRRGKSARIFLDREAHRGQCNILWD
jgi:hypothetical protein